MPLDVQLRAVLCSWPWFPKPSGKSRRKPERVAFVASRQSPHNLDSQKATSGRCSTVSAAAAPLSESASFITLGATRIPRRKTTEARSESAADRGMGALFGALLRCGLGRRARVAALAVPSVHQADQGRPAVSRRAPEIHCGAWASLAEQAVRNAAYCRGHSRSVLMSPVDRVIWRARMRAWAINAVRFARKSGQPFPTVWRPQPQPQPQAR
jgi:hypothetical protein